MTADLAHVYGGLYASAGGGQPYADNSYLLYPPSRPALSTSFEANTAYLQREQQQRQYRRAVADVDLEPKHSSLLVWVIANHARWMDAFLLLVIVLLTLVMVDAVYSHRSL
ncbi:MAG: hypothetical protein KGL42_13630 [Betaproteobacteria bacterium]|nr:hypothetical protein [Betaproteobacteria bacterium]